MRLAPVLALAVLLTVLLAGADPARALVFVPAPGAMSGYVAPGRMAAGDFDGDHRPDVLTADHDGVTLRLTDRRGRTRTAPHAHVALPEGFYGSAAGDFDGDGHRDLVAVLGEDPGLLFLRGNGRGGLTDTGRTSGEGDYSGRLATADFDRDGHLDVLVPTDGAAGVTVLRGDGDGRFSPVAREPSIGEGFAINVAVANLNSDRWPDVAISTFDPAHVSILLGGPGGHLRHAPGSPRRMRSADTGLTAGDVDHDGHQDLVVVSTAPWVLRGDGRGRFTPMTTPSTGEDAWNRNVASGDVDGDGELDLVVGDADSDTARVLLGDGRGRFRRLAGPPLWAGTAREGMGTLLGTQVDVADVDRDRRDDVIIGYGNRTSILLSRPGRPAAARFAATQTCGTGGRIAATVRGRHVRSVRFSIDGTTIRTVGRPNASGGGFRLSRPTSSIVQGTHVLRATITFTTSAPNRRFDRRLPRCPGAPAAPARQPVSRAASTPVIAVPGADSIVSWSRDADRYVAFTTQTSTALHVYDSKTATTRDVTPPEDCRSFASSVRSAGDTVMLSCAKRSILVDLADGAMEGVPGPTGEPEWWLIGRAWLMAPTRCPKGVKGRCGVYRNRATGEQRTTVDGIPRDLDDPALGTHRACRIVSTWLESSAREQGGRLLLAGPQGRLQVARCGGTQPAVSIGHRDPTGVSWSLRGGWATWLGSVRPSEESGHCASTAYAYDARRNVRYHWSFAPFRFGDDGAECDGELAIHTKYALVIARVATFDWGQSGLTDLTWALSAARLPAR